MKSCFRIACIAGVLFAALPLFAQMPSGPGAGDAAPAVAGTPAIPADQQATKEQIEKLFEVSRLDKQMQQMVDMMPRVVEQAYEGQMKDLYASLPPGKGISPEDQAALRTVLNKYSQQATTIYPIDEMLSAAIPIYQRHVSRADADAVIAFYSSPAGQHLLDEQPAILREYMPVVMANMQERIKHLTEQMAAEIQKVMKPDVSAPDTPAPAPNQ